MTKYDILLVDDEFEFCELMEESFIEEGYTMQMASNATTALEMLEKDDFSLIICDINMPRMTGLELLQELRKRKTLTSVVMLTAYSSDRRIVEAMRLGAIDYVVKPVPLEYLLSKTTIWLELAKKYLALSGSNQVDSVNFRKMQQIELYRVLNNRAG